MGQVICSRWWIGAALLAVSLAVPFAGAQDQGQKPQDPQEIPDAPSATRPAQTFPTNLPPAPRPEAPPERPVPGAAPAPAGSEATPPPMPPIKTIPPGSASTEGMNTRDDLYTFKVTTNFVLVPVTVKDDAGHLVDGLLPKDFSVFEDGRKESLKFFTSDPFPLSAAIVLDTGMSDVVLQKINQTYSALSGAFSPYDEVSLYTFSSTVSQVTDFSAVSQKLTAVLNQIKIERGRNNGVR